MTDFEKVMTGLECLTYVNFAIYKSECQERNCPYKDMDCEIAVMTDAYNLLTEMKNCDHPVIHCRDCKFAHITTSGECKYCDFWQDEGGDAFYLDGDFFCAAGEKRNGDG